MKTRKMIAAVMAVLCMTGAMPAMTSSASYDPRDVNHDGTISTLDVIAINHHLAGTKYYLEYNQLDANQSHTVDYADSRCVLNATINNSYSACYMRKNTNGTMQAVAMPSVSSTITLDSSVNQTTGRTYKRYSCTENAYLSDYTLTPTNVSLNTTSAQSRGLVNDNDNRVAASGNECTGIVHFGNDGTGFIVGDHVIATAASSIVDDVFGILEPVIFTCGTNGRLDGYTLTPTEIHVPAEYTDTADTLYDYALVVVEEDLSGYTHFDIGNSYNMTYSEAGTIPIHVTGVPYKTGDGLDVNNEINRLYTHNGRIYGSANTSLLRHTVDTSDGQEGSPIYTITREYYNNEYYYTYTALGIANSQEGTYVSNSGVLMTKHHLLFYGSNPYISNES